MTRLIIFRHGETNWNKEGRLMGHTDISLNEIGIAQAERLAERLKSEKIDKIYSSPLLRARKTAEIVNQNHGLEINFVDDLRELRIGKLEGELKSELKSKFPDFTWGDEKTYPKYEVQTFEDAKKELEEFVLKIKSETKSKNIAISTHSARKAALLIALGIEQEKVKAQNFSNCSVTIIEIEGDKLNIVCLGDASHIQNS